MQEQILEMTNITDNLLNVYNYAFTEVMPYGFFKPDDPYHDYIGVRLVKKAYHCPCCKKEFIVNFRNDNDGITYFSKSRIEAQKKVYEELGMTFPDESRLKEDESTYQAIGYCQECASKELNTSDHPNQRIITLCHDLHMQDELIAAKAKQQMTDAVKRWCDNLTESSQLLEWDLSTHHDDLKDLVCAIILEDTKELEKSLQEYRDTIQPMIYELKQLNAGQPMDWKCYVPRTSTIYESMTDEEYHEYTCAFPADDTEGQDFYIYRNVERERIDMFIKQRRIRSLEEMLVDTGFHEEWVDMVVDKGISLKK